MEVNRYKVQKKVSLQAHKSKVTENYRNNLYYMNVITCTNFPQGWRH